MRVVNVHEAKTHLSRLLEEVGEEGIVIARAGKPVARLIPYSEETEPRRLGGLRGRFVIPEDFDAPLPEQVLEDFEGAADAPSP